jgi:preprotein translocase subunit SecD
MYANLRWKILAVLAVTVLAVWSFYPPSQKIKLGLDLRGGVQMVLRVHTDDALKVETETAADQLHEALKAAGIAPTAVKALSLTEFMVEGIPQTSDAQFRQVADQQVTGSFDRESRGGGSHVFRMRPNIAVRNRSDAVTQALQTIERRVNEYGVTEPIVAPYGASGDQILVALPGVDDVNRAKDLIGRTARLEIKLVEGVAADEATLLQSHGGKLPPDMETRPGLSGTQGDPSKVLYLVKRTPVVTGTDPAMRGRPSMISTSRRSASR